MVLLVLRIGSGVLRDAYPSYWQVQSSRPHVLGSATISHSIKMVDRERIGKHSCISTHLVIRGTHSIIISTINSKMIKPWYQDQSPCASNPDCRHLPTQFPLPKQPKQIQILQVLTTLRSKKKENGNEISASKSCTAFEIDLNCCSHEWFILDPGSLQNFDVKCFWTFDVLAGALAHQVRSKLCGL